jgi:hypothetical protein
MIHIGTVQVNGHAYSLDLNRAAPETNDSGEEASSAPVRRNLPTTRSEIFLLNPSRKSAAHDGARPIAAIRAIDDLRRLGESRQREQAQTLIADPQRKITSEGAVKLVSRFLSWCFPVREFKSPLQRVIYLSVEKPKARYRSRYLLP